MPVAKKRVLSSLTCAAPVRSRARENSFHVRSIFLSMISEDVSTRSPETPRKSLSVAPAGRGLTMPVEFFHKTALMFTT